MARFYKTSDNALLNLDHVLVIQERDGMAVFRNTDAKVICEDNSFEMIAEEVVGQVFPAAPGWFALTFFPEDEHGPAMFSKNPIIGWRHSWYTTPICMHSTPEVRMVLTPDGQVIEYEGSHWKTEAEAIAEIVAKYKPKIAAA